MLIAAIVAVADGRDRGFSEHQSGPIPWTFDHPVGCVARLATGVRRDVAVLSPGWFGSVA